MIMRKFLRIADGKIFDVAAAPMYLVIFGIPALLIVVIIVLTVVAVKLIKRARIKNAETEGKPENSDSSEENK